MGGRSSAAVGWVAALSTVFAVLIVFGLVEQVRRAPATVTDAATGADVFVGNCAQCHGADARGAGAAPDLTIVFGRLSGGEVEATIRQGRDASPPMPAFEDELNEAEIDSVMIYLETLQREGDAGASPQRRGLRHGEGMWGGMMGDGWMGGWWVLWGILWLLVVLAVLGLLVTGIVWLVRSMTSERRAGSTTSAPSSAHGREILDARYARGEITRDEYLQARRDIGDPLE